jgi:hypothetical protein
MQPQRSKSDTFEYQKIATQKKRLEAQAALLPHGSERDELERKIGLLATAAHIYECLRSPGLRPPD